MTGALATVGGAALATGLGLLLVGRLDAPTWRRANYRGRTVTLLLGVVVAVVVVAGSLAVSPAAALAAGVAALAGLADDRYGDTGTKGLAGHLRALARGRVTSGAVKLLAVGAAALGAALLLPRDAPLLADAALVAGCANLLNLFDLRPGRALKVALLVAVPLAFFDGVARLVAGASAVALAPDVTERGMLGDTGANAVGAALGVALARVLGTPGTLAAVAVVVAATLVSERWSFSRVIDAVPPLRWADRVGRPA